MFDITIRYDRVPVLHMAPAIRRYVERGIPPGHFLCALLSNDLFEAFGRADDDNTAAMHAWTIFVYCELPSGCWGSSEVVNAWINTGGLIGQAAKEQV
jgi:hypothetical protein